jgi:hypothetical protein
VQTEANALLNHSLTCYTLTCLQFVVGSTPVTFAYKEDEQQWSENGQLIGGLLTQCVKTPLDVLAISPITPTMLCCTIF